MARRACRRLPVFGARTLYERLICPLRAVARRHGYALTVHGTLARDIDLVAVPWVMTVSPARDLAEAIRAEMEAITGLRAFWIDDEKADPYDYTRRNPEPKPHGRLAWSIYLGGAPAYVDLSIMETR